MEHFSGTRFILGKSFKFCGYQSREIIIKLRDEKEISKMLEFAAKSHDVLDENEKVYTLGRFHRKPESLCILPGLVPVFKRFVKAVDDLIPKPPNSQQAKNASFLEKDKSNESIDKNKKKPTNTDLESAVAGLESRMKKWVEEKLRKTQEIRLNTEEATRKFSLSVTANNQLKFQYKHLGCSEIFILANSPSGNLNLSNVQRHITKSCWLSTKSKQSSCDQEGSEINFKSKPMKVQTSIFSFKNTTKSKLILISQMTVIKVKIQWRRHNPKLLKLMLIPLI